jgi:hypothetical protein
MTFPETTSPNNAKPIPAAAAADLRHGNLPIVLPARDDVERRLAVKAVKGFAPPWPAGTG